MEYNIDEQFDICMDFYCVYCDTLISKFLIPDALSKSIFVSSCYINLEEILFWEDVEDYIRLID